MIIQEYIYRKLRNAGMTPEGACGTLGNIQGESGFIANNVEDRSGWSDAQYTAAVDNGTYTKEQFVKDGNGYGYAQWTYYTRKALYYEYFKKKNVSIADSDTQIDFLIWEMKNFFQTQWNMCCSSHDLYACTWELLDKWENPAEKKRAIIVRYTYAQNWYRQFKDLLIDDHNVTIEEVNNYGQNDAVGTYALLRRGSRGEGVKKIQEQLSELGYDVGSFGADGIFGIDTEKAVIAFQSSHQLEVDGIVGNETRKKLLELLSEKEKKSDDAEDYEASKIPKDRVVLPEIKMDDGADTSYIKLAQAALTCWGYNIIITGIFGKEMDHKVRDFQSNKSLCSDGVIGKDTWKALFDFHTGLSSF